jgi:hypothetical protein
MVSVKQDKDMTDNKNLAWKAICELDEYFSRLGGTARPINMANYEIPLYVCHKLLMINGEPIDQNGLNSPAFLKAAAPVLEKSNALLSEVGLSSSELIPFVLKLYEHADAKLNEIDKSNRWAYFGEYLRKKVHNQST